MAELPRRLFLGAAGAAAAVGATSLAGLTSAQAARCKGRVFYVGSYTSPGAPVGHGLDVTTTSNGPALTLDHTVSGVSDASWFAFSPDGRILFSTNEGVPDGHVTSLDVRDPAKPRKISTQPSRGSAPTHLCVHPSGRYLLTANYGTGSVVVHPIARDGRLGASTDLVVHHGAERDAHAHQVVVDPSGRWVLSVDLGADSVYVYSLDLKTGKLKQHQQLVLPSGAGPRHLAFHPNGRFAYIAQELRPEVTVATWDAAAGKLAAGAVVPAVDASSPGPNYPGEIEVSADGRFAYVSVRGENTVATFAVKDGGLERLGANATTGGDWPRHLVLDPGQRGAYVSNQNSGTVTWLPRDTASGKLGAPQRVFAVPSVATVAFRH
ncbi:lactonase family protein [Amycolatopsis sp. CA-230715]|uniref:lactonase family protein n=1 Tax=Amycolatopsis sp. CA-230715 TaxID=2745196 RepID=UPI001C0301E0|nr:lactonase family protein [Amycolatopsis sp. CA-230715]QWF77176.1 6-phosphogluconolactonase [Amycolatopsis sp. CA-230715]